MFIFDALEELLMLTSKKIKCKLIFLRTLVDNPDFAIQFKFYFSTVAFKKVILGFEYNDLIMGGIT